MSVKDYPAIIWVWRHFDHVAEDGTIERVKAMVPVGPYAKMADRFFAVDDKYRLAAREERSAVSHRHYFAAIREAWETLPEQIASKYPSPEYLRAQALVETGQCDETNYIMPDHEAAQRLAGTLRKQLPFAVMVCRENILRVMVPHSQAQSAMDKKEFQESKTKVLDYLARLLDVKRSDLEKRGKAAA